MPELKNKRAERFCLLLVSNTRGRKTDADCYVEAGYVARTPEAAAANASRLISSDNVKARLQELRGAITERVLDKVGVTTTDVAKHLWDLSTYDLSKVFKPVATGRGANRQTRLVLRPPEELPSWWGKISEGVRVKPDGTCELLWPDRRLSGIKVGEHLGMFQGEAAGAIPGQPPPGGTTINNDNRTFVYVDAPAPETMEQWKARVTKERGLVTVDVKPNGKNGAGNGTG